MHLVHLPEPRVGAFAFERDALIPLGVALHGARPRPRTDAPVSALAHNGREVVPVVTRTRLEELIRHCHADLVVSRIALLPHARAGARPPSGGAVVRLGARLERTGDQALISRLLAAEHRVGARELAIEISVGHPLRLEREAVSDKVAVKEDEGMVVCSVDALEVLVQVPLLRRWLRPHELREARTSRLEALPCDTGARAPLPSDEGEGRRFHLLELLELR